MNHLTDALVARIRERGPLTVAEYMAAALHDPDHGYYSTASRRSGRDGDFFTSVDTGPLFGQLLAAQVAEMWRLLREEGATGFHLVEAGAGDGRLARDMLDAMAEEWPDLYAVLRVTLVDASPAARASHTAVLGPHGARVRLESASGLPRDIVGAIVANELLDALPVHVVVRTPAGMGEVHVGEADGALREVVLPLANPRVERELARHGATLTPGGRAEVGLAAIEWVQQAAGALTQGFLLLVDYGHEAADLYSATHSGGTLTTYRRHSAGAVHWLDSPGTSDLTSHVNLTSVREAATASGLEPLGTVDQTYFLVALGLADRLDEGQDVPAIRRRLAAGTLIAPGGLGSTMKVLAFGKTAGPVRLTGLSSGRVT